MGMMLALAGLLVLLYCEVLLRARGEPVQDRQALLDFVSQINHTRGLNWDVRIPVCTGWTGVTCNHDNSRVIGVRLPGVGFRGEIPNNTLSRLSALQILSLRSNAITGSFPPDLLDLGSLVALYMQFNRFEGPLPSDVLRWKSLSVLNLSNNRFNGSIPVSTSNLTQLTYLNLANNLLGGHVPDLDLPSLQILDLADNNLTGTVPPSLLRFPSSAFAGNNVMFENSSSPVPPSIAVAKKHSKFSQPAILGIVIGSCTVAFVLIALLLVVSNRKKKDDSASLATSWKKEKSSKRMVPDNKNGNGRLTFFEGTNLVFDLEDLLRASAEVLGKGTFGTTYKAALEDTTTVAVKRLREVIVGRKEFEQQMEIVGSIRHDNVAPLRAYYYSKEEKLMVYDYYNHGSMSALLYAKRGENRIPLDWETRLRIATGAARGIAHIHSQSGKKLVHGNIKASNIFINSQLNGCISDLGLATLMSPIAPPVPRNPGYRAPEITDPRKVTQASDVYSFGIVLLELLTGKSPVHGQGSDEVIHLVRWVQSVVREEWTGEVFDVELLRYSNIEEEMVAVLQIGLNCVTRMPEQRPKIGDVVKMLEEMRAGNSPSVGTKSPGSTATPTSAAHVGGINGSSVS